MAQHFLLSPKARTLSISKIEKMSDDEAFDLFCQLRWGSKENVVCPRCSQQHKAYFIKSRQQWQCKFCSHRFSVTSSTIFAHHKLTLKTYLSFICLYANAAKGISALQISRTLGIGYKYCFMLCHKIREALFDKKPTEPLSGEVHMDGTYVHTAPKPKNKKADRVDRRKKVNDNPQKCCVLVIRNRFSEEEIKQNPLLKGAKTTYTFPIRTENSKDISALAELFIKKGSKVHADENPAYDGLLKVYDLHRVNHQIEYRSDDGVTNNLAESFFSRFKRLLYGQCHRMSNKYLYLYANEIAYREDTRRQSNSFIQKDILSKCLSTKPHRDWIGYAQGNHKSDFIFPQ